MNLAIDNEMARSIHDLVNAGVQSDTVFDRPSNQKSVRLTLGHTIPKGGRTKKKK